MFTDTPENYRKRIKALPARISQFLAALPADGGLDDARRQQLEILIVELNELLNWKVYNDSYSRTSSWLFRDYLSLKPDEARLASLAVDDLNRPHRYTVAEAFQAYCDLVRRRRLSDPAIAAWLAAREDGPDAG